MRTDLQLTAVQMGWAFSVFSWAYALFEIPGGLAGRSHRPAPRADAHRDLVVVLHGGHRLGLEFRVAARRRARSSERARLAAFPNLTRAFTTWLPLARARAGAGDPVAQRALGRRVHAAAGRVLPGLRDVAARLRDLRAGRHHLGDRVLPLVSRRSAHAPVGQRGGAGAAAAAGARPRPCMDRSPGRVSSRAPPSGCCGFSTSVSATAGGSTSPGCRRICGTRAASA